MEILANLCESALWITFLKIFCRPKYSRKIDFSGAVTAILLLMTSIGFRIGLHYFPNIRFLLIL